jgi:hypothetical protein
MILYCSRLHRRPSRGSLQRKASLTVLLALTLGSTWQRADAQQKQACNLSQFQGNASSIGPEYPASSCKTCVFPSWSDVSLDTTSILQLDLTGKWLYMLGDSTTHQLHEELLSYLDEPLVSLFVALVTCRRAHSRRIAGLCTPILSTARALESSLQEHAL